MRRWIVSLVVLFAWGASAALRVVAPDQVVPTPPTHTPASFRERVFALQVRQALDRFRTDRALERAGVLRARPSEGQGGSITGSVSVSPAPPAGVSYEGEILALDRFGFVAGYDFWSQSSGPSYRINDLPAGEYYVFFLSEGWTYDAQVGTVVNQFFQNTTQWTQATKVRVTDGGTASNINFQLQSNSGYVSVTVRTGTGQPLANTPVEFTLYPYRPTEQNQLVEPGRALHYALETNASGQVTVGPVPLGTFYMSCQAENYGTLFYPNTPDPASAQSLTLASVGQTISNIQFNLPAGGNISGRVTLDNGQPGMFVMVEAYRVGSSEAAGTALAMFDGSYELEGLPAGHYLVHADPSLMLPTYAGEWWDNKPNAQMADPVVVEPGQTTSGIDFVLSVGGSIRGTISSDMPSAFQEAVFVISAYEPDDSLRPVAFTFSQGLGQYTLGGLQPGAYKVSLQGMPYPMVPLYYHNATSFQQASTVTVPAGGSATNINFSLASRGRISGRVTLAGGGGQVSDVVDFVIAYPVNLLQGEVPLWFIFPNTVNDDGTYTIVGLPTGDYRVWVSTQPADYGQIGFCAEFYNGAYSFETATNVHVVEGQTTSGIDVQLDREAILQGFVSLPNNTPAGDEDAEVIVLAYDAQTGHALGLGESDWAPVYTEGGNTFCAGYRIRGLPGRPVKVAAVPHGAQAAVGYYGGGHTFAQGASVTLTTGQVYPTDVNITLSQGNARISGMVTRDDEGSPLNWVVIASYDPTGHLTGFATSGIDPSTQDPWTSGYYEIRSLVGGSAHFVRAWSLFAWMYYNTLNPGAGVVVVDEWYDDLSASGLPGQVADYLPFGLYTLYGFFPSVSIPAAATQVTAPSSGVNFALGFLGVGVHDHLVAPGGLSLASLTPNPSTGRVELSLASSVAQPVVIDLLDLAGRSLGSTSLGLLDSGTHRVYLDVTQWAHPTSGPYVLRIRGADTCVTKPLVVLR